MKTPTFTGGGQDLLERGIWQAPWLGPDGETVLLAVTHDHCLNAAPLIVPREANRAEASTWTIQCESSS